MVFLKEFLIIFLKVDIFSQTAIVVLYVLFNIIVIYQIFHAFVFNKNDPMCQKINNAVTLDYNENNDNISGNLYKIQSNLMPIAITTDNNEKNNNRCFS